MDGMDKGAGGCFFAWFGLCALVALACAGVAIWAVIALVSHFTA